MNETIVSRIILGAECDPGLVAALAPKPGVQVNFSLFETTVTRGSIRKTVLCCWAGGQLDHTKAQDDPGAVSVTPVGRAAIDALMRLPAGMDARPVAKGRLVFRELRLGRTPLKTKVINAILTAEPGDRIAFVGDLAKELDGHMSPAFNLGEPILLEERS